MTALRDQLDEESSWPTPDFRQVFETHARYVWRVLRRMGVPESDVPDVAQEVFVILRRKLHHVRSPAALRSFIYGIAVREASDHRRQARVRYERVVQALPEETVDPNQEVALERARALTLLERALQNLDASKRAVFVLYELEELEMHEVASALGCPLQTAYSRLHAARAAVSAAFERAGHGERSEP